MTEMWSAEQIAKVGELFSEDSLVYKLACEQDARLVVELNRDHRTESDQLFGTEERLFMNLIQSRSTPDDPCFSEEAARRLFTVLSERRRVRALIDNLVTSPGYAEYLRAEQELSDNRSRFDYGVD